MVGSLPERKKLEVNEPLSSGSSSLESGYLGQASTKIISQDGMETHILSRVQLGPSS